MTNVEKELLGFEAAENIVEGDVLYVNADGKAAKVTSAEATNAFGLAYNNANAGDRVSVLVRGLTTVRVLVSATGTAAGYNAAVVPGSRLLISGKAAGTYTEGQALSSDQGVGATGGDGTVVAKALESVAGAAGTDTYTTIRAYVDFLS